MLTGKDIHEMYAMTHLDAKHWDDVSPIAKRLYERIAQTIEVEKSSIAAVKCPTCEKMISACRYTEHTCTSSDVLTDRTASTSQFN